LSLYFQVIAEEKNTNPRLSSTATVIVSIADANDNVPIFQQQQYTASVSEMASPGTLVTTITATDRDSGQFGENGIVYQLSGADADKLVSFMMSILWKFFINCFVVVGLFCNTIKCLSYVVLNEVQGRHRLPQQCTDCQTCSYYDGRGPVFNLYY
jgi:hypothetical protein